MIDAFSNSSRIVHTRSVSPAAIAGDLPPLSGQQTKVNKRVQYGWMGPVVLCEASDYNYAAHAPMDFFNIQQQSCAKDSPLFLTHAKTPLVQPQSWFGPMWTDCRASPNKVGITVVTGALMPVLPHSLWMYEP
jgi:hypothetical protein